MRKNQRRLLKLHQYVEGTYTIFPEKKRLLRFLFLRQDKYRFSIFGRRNRNRKGIQPPQVVEEPQRQAAKYSRNVGDYLYLEDDRLL